MPIESSIEATYPADDRTPDDASADWLLLEESDSLEAHCASWLRLQAQWIGVVARAVVCRQREQGPSVEMLAALADDDPVALRSLVEATFAEGVGLAGPIGSDESRLGVSHLLKPVASAPVAVAVEIAARPDSDPARVLRQLQWGSAWLLRRIEAQSAGSALSASASPAHARAILDVIALGLSAPSYEEGCQALVSQLARMLGCERVSIGVRSKDRARVAAISHSAAFGREMNLVRAIEAAMDEALDQNASVLHPAPPDQPPLVLRQHEALERDHGARTVLTIPIQEQDASAAAVTFEHGEAGFFTPERIELLDTMLLAVAPILELRRREDRSLVAKALEAGRTQLGKLIGPGHLTRKLVLAAVLVLGLFFGVAEGRYRIAAEGTLEGTSRRVVIAPFDGYVAEAFRRAGDLVEEGELLATLDDREIELERLKWASRLVQLERQSDEARAAREYGRTSILEAQTKEARAELGRLEDRLARTRVVAPFGGLVVSGDLSQSLGAALSRGDTLFEIAPLERYRVLLEVDEEQIGDVRVSQKGELLLSAVPGERFPFEVTKVTPVARAMEGRNFFRVEGSLESPSTRLRPGMEGVGKIEVEDRRWVWIWTRSFQNWLRLWVWSWWP